MADVYCSKTRCMSVTCGFVELDQAAIEYSLITPPSTRWRWMGLSTGMAVASLCRPLSGARSDEDPLPDEDHEPLERSGGDVENPPAQRG